MTRQKKELLREIREIDDCIALEKELGCGFAPADAFAELEDRQWGLLEKLARLSHYGNATEMLNDDRHIPGDDSLPFR
ncbi:MAG: hypothetical protein IKD70_06520 [Eggerthellaceae bacterium]|nr:hypothetical protein [Eggerthellaceae bacterium]